MGTPYNVGMNIEISGPEKELLVDVLKGELGELRQQVYKAESPRFKDELKGQLRMLEGLISRLPS